MMKIYFSMSHAVGMAVLLSSMAFSASAAEKISVVSANPADGSVVESLKRINLELANRTEVGVEWKSGLKAPVTNADGEEVTYAKGQDYGSQFVLSLNKELTEPGTYTISVPAGAMFTPDWDAEVYPLPAVVGSECDAFTLTNTNDAGSGVNAMSGEETSVEVFNMNGVKVSGGDTDLTPGIYIVKEVRGEKTTVKRVVVK